MQTHSCLAAGNHTSLPATIELQQHSLPAQIGRGGQSSSSSLGLTSSLPSLILKRPRDSVSLPCAFRGVHWTVQWNIRIGSFVVVIIFYARYPQYTRKIAWCSCIGEKVGEEVKRRDMMTEKETEKIITGTVNTKVYKYWTDVIKQKHCYVLRMHVRSSCSLPWDAFIMSDISTQGNWHKILL